MKSKQSTKTTTATPAITITDESAQRAKAVTGTIVVEPATYGILCAGAKVNGFPSWEATASYLLNEMACEWQNDDYRVR